MVRPEFSRILSVRLSATLSICGLGIDLLMMMIMRFITILHVHKLAVITHSEPQAKIRIASPYGRMSGFYYCERVRSRNFTVAVPAAVSSLKDYE